MRQQLVKSLRGTQRQLQGLLEWFVVFFPDPLGRQLRYRYWKGRLRSLGRDVSIGIGVRILKPEWVSIGDRCWIDDYVLITGGPSVNDGAFVYRKENPDFSFREGDVVVGERVHIAPFVQLQGHGGLSVGSCLTIAAGAKIYSLSHHYRDLTGASQSDTIFKFVGLVPPEEQALISAPVVVHDNAAVGLNSVVLPGSTMGRNSWLGAMSLLRGDVPPNAIAMGVPAEVIRSRVS